MNPATPLKETVLASARKHREEFSRITGGFEDRGILNSEMLVVCSLAEDLGVDVFIESGRWLGQSTEILARYFNGKPIIIESIEAFYDDNALYVEKKLADKKNLSLLYGDAGRLIPKLVKRYQGKKIALLFDGPKGQAAIDIFRLALTLSHSVVAGFFHDMRRPTVVMPNESRSIMEHEFPESFYTDENDFVTEFQMLDQGCDVALWKPYLIDGKKIGSYGPTIGLTLPTPDDYYCADRERWHLLLRISRRVFLLDTVKLYQKLRQIFSIGNKSNVSSKNSSQ